MKYDPDPVSMNRAIISAMNAVGDSPEYMVVVDYTQPSYKKRLFVLHHGAVIRMHHVAHGSNSSALHDKSMAVSFSNKVNSHKSSLGLMKTGQIYYGRHGKSLKLKGLEKGKNDNVFLRYIVIHPSKYVTNSYIDAHGYAGCSWGCLAVDPAISSSLIDLIKGGCPVYAYHE